MLLLTRYGESILWLFRSSWVVGSLVGHSLLLLPPLSCRSGTGSSRPTGATPCRS